MVADNANVKDYFLCYCCSININSTVTQGIGLYHTTMLQSSLPSIINTVCNV